MRPTVTLDDPFTLTLDAQAAAAAECGFAPVICTDTPAALSTPCEFAPAQRIGVPAILEAFAGRGFTRFLLDPAEELVERADTLALAELEEAASFLVEDGILPAGWMPAYLGREFLAGPTTLRFSEESLLRAAVKFGWALARVGELVDRLAVVAPEARWELACNRTTKATSPHEHLFLARELQRRCGRPAAVVLALPRPWEPAADFTGDLAELESALAAHTAIAQQGGGYGLRLVDAAEKRSAWPVVQRVCGANACPDLTGLAWLAAMRLLARAEPALLRAALRVAQEQFSLDRSGLLLSTSEEDVLNLPEVPDAALEATFFEDPRGRQLLHVARGSVFSALGDQIAVVLKREVESYGELVVAGVREVLSVLRDQRV